MEELKNLRSLFRDDKLIDVGTLAGALKNPSEEDKKYKISFIVFISPKFPINLFKIWNGKEFSFKIDEYADFWVVNLHRSINKSNAKDPSREIFGHFALFQHKKTNMWVAFTNETRDFFDNGVVKFIESYRPDISRIYFSSEELRNLFEELEESLSCKIFVKKAVLYSHIKEGQIRFEKDHFQELFNRAENESSYVDKVEYEFHNNVGSIYHGFVSRGLIFYYYSGNINYFFNGFLPLIAEKGIKKTNIFENKERKFGEIQVQPICIEFQRDVFNNNMDNIRLIKALEKVSKSALAVYHKNPYLHASFLDFIDGSIFDIFATGTNRLTIVPNYKCSMHSLMRVSEQISKDFEEGTVSLRGRSTYSLSDFMGE